MPHPLLPEPQPDEPFEHESDPNTGFGFLHTSQPAPTPPEVSRWDFNFDPKGVGFTREQFMAQADDVLDKWIVRIQGEAVSTPVLANALLKVHCDNWHELMAVWFATALQRLAFLSPPQSSHDRSFGL